MENRVAREFQERSVYHLREEFLPRIERAVERLPAADLWWRPHEGCTSVGNLIKHLEGNVRQWILSGLGGYPDARHRASEFEVRDGASADELLEALRGTVEEACAVVTGLDEAELLRSRDIQVFEGVSGLAAILHVVEHFSWHTGQIAWVAKLRSGRGLDYFDDTKLE
jgi:uncharacterized damage-inducible protein DinB